MSISFRHFLCDPILDGLSKIWVKFDFCKTCKTFIFFPHFLTKRKKWLFIFSLFLKRYCSLNCRFTTFYFRKQQVIRSHYQKMTLRQFENCCDISIHPVAVIWTVSTLSPSFSPLLCIVFPLFCIIFASPLLFSAFCPLCIVLVP